MTGRLPLLVILVIAAVLYFWALGRPDVITDESSHATRAIGLVDFDFGIEQPTPWQWVGGQPPWWMRLSFHDHPPLVFLLQHYSIKLFGENPTAIRIPSALAGLTAVIFVYLIGKRLYSPAAGAASALLFAVTVSHVWISRVGLLESVMLAILLASFWAFLCGLEDSKWLPLSGALFGLSFLAKYNAVIILPVFLTIFILTRIYHTLEYDKNGRFRWKVIVIAAALFLAVASPIIVYNVQLWRNFGHFDFQFSQLFGQDVEAWQARPGQEVLGSFSERLRTYVPRLIEANSPYFLILAALGLATIAIQLIHRFRSSDRSFVISHSSLVIVFLWLLPFLVFIGPAHRFLTLLTPWLAIAAGYAIAAVGYSHVLKNLRIKRIAFAAFAAFVVFEAFYSYNSVIALDPIGPRPWARSYLHRQAGSWGFNELEKYLSAELAGKTPEVAVTFEFPFASNLLSRSAVRTKAAGFSPEPIGIVYNDNINLSAQLWVFLRRIVYSGWPVTSAENFRRGGGDGFFREAGIRDIYFINATEYALQDRTRPPTPDGDILEGELGAKGLVSKEIKNARGEVAFRAYQFELR